jgi:hypothetical protein
MRLRFPEMHVSEPAVHEENCRAAAHLVDVQFSHGSHFERR